jgi:hypothetical protein
MVRPSACVPLAIVAAGSSCGDAGAAVAGALSKQASAIAAHAASQPLVITNV